LEHRKFVVEDDKQLWTMASICRSNYVLVSEGDSADGRALICAETDDFDPTANTTSEKHQPPWPETDIEQLNRRSIGGRERIQCLKYSFKLQLLLLLACFVGLGLFARSFLSCGAHSEAAGVRLLNRGQNAQPAVEETFLSRPEVPSSPVLEVFQVYQPVLAPSGPTDQTIESDGSSNTTVIGSTEAFASCTQLLMEYSFGFSYGHPFVGKFLILKNHTLTDAYYHQQAIILRRHAHSIGSS
jgi:hypothetical protein